jgi:hypothetical protein
MNDSILSVPAGAGEQRGIRSATRRRHALSIGAGSDEPEASGPQSAADRRLGPGRASA